MLKVFIASKSKVLIFISILTFIAIIVLLWQGLYLQSSTRTLPSAMLNKKIPNLLANYNNNEPMLVNIWSSWCEACREEHNLWLQTIKPYPIKTIGIVFMENGNYASEFLNKYGNPYDNIINDSEGSLCFDLGVQATPETFLIDNNSIIRFRYTGPITEQVWKEVLEPKVVALTVGH